MTTRARKSDESMSADPPPPTSPKEKRDNQTEGKGAGCRHLYALRKTAAHRLSGDGSGFSSYGLKDSR